MDRLLYVIARLVVGALQSLPLRVVARIGRCSGALAYWLDARHRRVAIRNLTASFSDEMAHAEIMRVARENFKRIGENFASAAKTASMPFDILAPDVEFKPNPQFMAALARPDSRIVVAIGHFGNFELYARFGKWAGTHQCATTYRGLRQPRLNALLQQLREKSGCLYFERRFQGAELKTFMAKPNIVLGLLADQHAGRNGLRLPFFGRECSTSPAPAIFALRYNCALFTGICFRTASGKWRMEAGSEIQTHTNGSSRSVEEIMLDVNRAFETAVRRDPANWFWVHNRWKPFSRKPAKSFGAKVPDAPNVQQTPTTSMKA
jgi:KDO2-lipid IV(A) lauroyltransferase